MQPRQDRKSESARRRLIILTGPPGAGKTTCCRALAASARAASLRVGGITAVVSTPDATATGAERWVEDLDTGERRLLGVQTGAATDGVPGWRLNDDALAWSAEVLRRGCPLDLLVIDEVGPVELIHRRGAMTGVEHALAGPYRLAVAVVRPWLVPRFRQLFSAPAAELVDVSDTTVLRTFLAELIASRRTVDGDIDTASAAHENRAGASR